MVTHDGKYNPYSIDVILLNGPPGCGKDTISNGLWGASTIAGKQFKQMEIKRELFQQVFKYFHLDLEEQRDFYELYNSRETKELPCGRLDDLSPRGAMIYVSEEVCKPEYGNNFFGKEAAHRLLEHWRSGAKLAVFSDGGFREEVQELAKVANLFVVRLHGRGDWGNDSRSYLDTTGLDVWAEHDLTLVDGKAADAVRTVWDLYETARHKCMLDSL
ncbi:hypothetical protein BN109_033 [Yersinia phage phi80-18]|uniref:Uncharacterized protein n=1 Tax=Yersinia phage phi80-18 TaxID=1206559 RepID=I7LEU2_9CAUD|nr:hypothetical protein BN109_033 [Yersinia phage phi80-18]CCI88872.2 hypothetical protein BN109_033 [Yersinia phage phi80-18]